MGRQQVGLVCPGPREYRACAAYGIPNIGVTRFLSETPKYEQLYISPKTGFDENVERLTSA